MKPDLDRLTRNLGLVMAIVLTLTAVQGSPQQARKTPDEPAGPALPDTPAGKCVAAYIGAFNSSDPQKMRTFFAEHTNPSALERTTVERRVERTRGLQQELRGLELRRVVEASESAVTVLLQSLAGDWVEFAFQFEPAPPHRLLGIRVEQAEPPGESAGPPPENYAALAQAIDAYLTGLAQADEFSGVVLVARGEEPIFLQAYGLADRGLGVPNRTNTKFNLGSINKLFTTIGIGQLLEQSKLSPGDTIGKFLPAYPNREAAAKVTVKQLLEMRSGIGDVFGERVQTTPKDRLRTISDYLPLFADKPLEFEPGTQRRYSNGGFVVLGAIIEKASGQDYYTFVRDHIFKPLGMASTESYEADAVVPNLAMGYSYCLPNRGRSAHAPRGAAPQGVGTRPPRTCSASASRCRAARS